MRTLGIDVGTRGIRLSVLDNGKFIYEEKFKKEEVFEGLKIAKGMGVRRVCIAGGYQWRELKGPEALNDETVAFGSVKESHGLRRIVRNSLTLFKEVCLLPSGGASGAISEAFLKNSLDTGTPDKVAKANYLYWNYSLKDFTLIDKGMFVTILYVKDGSIINFFSATRGMPSPMSPGIVDLELLVVYDWPKRKDDIWSSGVGDEVTEKWIEFLRPTFVGEVVRCPGELCDEFSASRGAALWCHGLKLKNLFSDSYERHLTIKARIRRELP